MPGRDQIDGALRAAFPNAVMSTVDRLTEGQACTAALGLDALDPTDETACVTFGACDFGCLYDATAFQRLLDDPGTDVIVWAVRGNVNAMRRPRMFGWIATESDGERIAAISVKQPLEDPARDPIVLGTFTFRSASDFRACLDRMVARDARVNGEFYLDTCINDAIALGLDCRVFVVDHYLSWGTPDDLRTFEYWQSCFHQWSGHPYRIERDPRVPADAVQALVDRYRATPPVPPRTAAAEGAPT